MTRLDELQQHLPDTEEVPAMPDPGLKEAVEVAPLSRTSLRTELEQVKGAEAGAVFDFPIDLNDKVLAWVHAVHHRQARLHGADPVPGQPVPARWCARSSPRSASPRTWPTWR